MQNIHKFLPIFSLSFIVGTIMAFCISYFPVVVGSTNWSPLAWNSFSREIFGILFFVGLIVSLIISVYTTKEDYLFACDKPKSFKLRVLIALGTFIPFLLISFIISYIPFAIVYESFNPKNWGDWGSLGTAANWSGFILFSLSVISCVCACNIADKNQVK